MKKTFIICLGLGLGMIACNNESTDKKDSVEKADSVNEVKMDSSSVKQTIATDEESTNFLVKAADGGMTEVKAADLAAQKGVSKEVKDFAAMMKMDHGAANNEVMALAKARNVTLPEAVSADHQKDLDDLNGKGATDFDKAYVKAMVKDHESDVDMFKKASDKVNDTEVKAFIDNTLPTLQKHLDMIKQMDKNMKK